MDNLTNTSTSDDIKGRSAAAEQQRADSLPPPPADIANANQAQHLVGEHVNTPPCAIEQGKSPRKNKSERSPSRKKHKEKTPSPPPLPLPVIAINGASPERSPHPSPEKLPTPPPAIQQQSTPYIIQEPERINETPPLESSDYEIYSNPPQESTEPAVVIYNGRREKDRRRSSPLKYSKDQQLDKLPSPPPPDYPTNHQQQQQKQQQRHNIEPIALINAEPVKPDNEMLSNTRECCDCPGTNSRCATDECPCFTSGVPCSSMCETSKLAANCLNRIVTNCQCTNTGEDHNHQHHKANHHAPSASGCSSPHQCDCFRFREPCTVNCACKRENCRHTESVHHVYSNVKLPRPTKGCKCSGGKKGCIKQKCACRASLGHCSPSCKCRQDCANAERFPLSKTARQCFLMPDQDTSALVLCLYGSDGYRYRQEFVNSDKNLFHAPELLYETLLNAVYQFAVPIEHIAVFMSKSPCFHQDCEPKCEILEQCEAQKACAKVLVIAYQQIQRHLLNCNVRMSVKFLCPYVKRGDLYTQQGIHHLMENGISVEPLVMKEWGDLMQDNTNSTPPPMFIWNQTNMEDYVRKTQHYINMCRKNLNVAQVSWTSGFHDVLKNAVVTCGVSRQRIDLIYRRLLQLQERDAQQSHSRSCMSVSSSVPERPISTTLDDSQIASIMGLEDTSQYNSLLLSLAESQLGGPHEPDVRYGSIRSQASASTISTGKPRQRRSLSSRGVRRSKTTNLGFFGGASRAHQDNEREGSMTRSFHDSRDGTISAASTLKPFMPPINLERVLLNLSGRPMSESERKEMQTELTDSVERLRHELTNILQMLDRRSGATPV